MLTLQENNDPILSSILPLSSANLNDDGIYLLENGEDCLFYVGNMVNSEILQQIFGVTSVDGLPTQVCSSDLSPAHKKGLVRE